MVKYNKITNWTRTFKIHLYRALPTVRLAIYFFLQQNRFYEPETLIIIAINSNHITTM